MMRDPTPEEMAAYRDTVAKGLALIPKRGSLATAPPSWFLDRIDRFIQDHPHSENRMNFIDKTATVPASTVVWHFARVLANAVLGDDCSVGGGSEIGRGTIVGHRTRISAGVFIPSNARIGNDVFIGPNVTMTDDRFPRTLNKGESYNAEPPTIGNGASIGAGAILLPGVRIGERARIAAGSVVTRDVPDDGTVRGEPARPFTLSRSAQKAFSSDWAENLNLVSDGNLTERGAA